MLNNARDRAIISAADIEAIQAFVATMTARGKAAVQGVKAGISGKVARGLWIAGQPGSRYTWNRAALQFQRGSTPVARVTIKAAADAVSKEAQFKLMDAALRMGQGKLEIAAWIVEHDTAVKMLHGAESALARGGFAEMTGADWIAASDRVTPHLEASAGFHSDVRAGRYGVPGATDFREAGALHRASQYANVGRYTYENTLTENARDRLGHTHARRILAAVSHCESCADVAAQGWVPMDEYPEIGTDDCGPSCHCVTVTGTADE